MIINFFKKCEFFRELLNYLLLYDYNCKIPSKIQINTVVKQYWLNHNLLNRWNYKYCLR